MFSAVKVNGVPLYKAARAGQTVARMTRVCHIHQLSVDSVRMSQGNPAMELPVPIVDVVFNVVCGKGTYIRTLCADIGDVLGVGGHLLQLERRRVGHFTLDEAVTMDELAESVGQHGVLPRLHAIADALRQLPALTLDAVSSEGVQHGTACTATGILKSEGQWVAGSAVRLHGADGQLLAIGKVPWNSDDVDRYHSTAAVKIEKVLV
jgi:tRNA pseudouridine55 synthase